ncbi:MAG: hypothetical protein IJS62_04130 [Bacteroidales bacterium]|nr:hypothetical protein [Bacteroidales bacterium]
MRGHSLLYLFFFLLACTSCSVKEDRSECPCILSLYTSDAAGKTVGVEVWNTGGVCVARGETDATLLELKVPRGHLKVTAWSGLADCRLLGGVVSIPRGGQMDELCAWRSEADCSGEQASLILFLHKQWATVNLKLENYPFPQALPDLKIRGAVNGYDLASGLPVEGGFLFSPPFSGEGDIVFRLPRQHGGELLLEVGPKVLAIGDMIVRSGYDWEEPDLDDIYIWVDYLKSTVKIGISDWNEVAYEENF